MAWYLDPAGNGTVYTSYMCGQPFWSVDGGLTNGSFYLFASNPTWGEFCATYFEYDGTLLPGGCNFGTGTWYNDYGSSGNFVMSKPCEKPSSETTSQTLGNWDGGAFVFQVTVEGTSSGNLSGRLYRESNYATGIDDCYYDGSPIPEFKSVTNLNPFPLYSANQYIDPIGRGDMAIQWYRAHEVNHPLPCSATLFQRMQIACGALPTLSWQTVQSQVLVATIGATTVTVSRGSVVKGPHPY